MQLWWILGYFMQAMNSKCPKIMHENLMTRIKQKRKVNVNRTQYLFTSQIRPAAQSSAGGGRSGASGRGDGAVRYNVRQQLHNSIDSELSTLRKIEGGLRQFFVRGSWSCFAWSRFSHPSQDKTIVTIDLKWLTQKFQASLLPNKTSPSKPHSMCYFHINRQWGQ